MGALFSAPTVPYRRDWVRGQEGNEGIGSEVRKETNNWVRGQVGEPMYDNKRAHRRLRMHDGSEVS